MKVLLTAECSRCGARITEYRDVWWSDDDNFMCPDGEEAHAPGTGIWLRADGLWNAFYEGRLVGLWSKKRWARAALRRARREMWRWDKMAKTECPTCKGEGKYRNGTTCQTCGGSGEVEKASKEDRKSLGRRQPKKK